MILRPTKFVSAVVVKRENSPSQASIITLMEYEGTLYIWLLGPCDYNASKVSALWR